MLIPASFTWGPWWWLDRRNPLKRIDFGSGQAIQIDFQCEGHGMLSTISVGRSVPVTLPTSSLIGLKQQAARSNKTIQLADAQRYLKNELHFFADLPPCYKMTNLYDAGVTLKGWLESTTHSTIRSLNIKPIESKGTRAPHYMALASHDLDNPKDYARNITEPLMTDIPGVPASCVQNDIATVRNYISLLHSGIP